jgi:hypothetical protein
VRPADRPQPHRRAPGELTAADLTAIRDAVLALPPLSEEQIEGICEVIVNFRQRHPHTPTK